MRFPSIDERLLRTVWQRRAFAHRPLLTADGRRVTVRFPGHPNADEGPDFTDARILIGRVLYRGDVEIHPRARSWRAHGHERDPHYNRVILHVVFFPSARAPAPHTASGRRVPLLVLRPFLRARSMRGTTGEVRPPRCRALRRPLPPVRLARTLHAIGLRRIARKSRWLDIRLRDLASDPDVPTAPDQLLYECLLEAMGYARNRGSFLALGRAVPIGLLRAHGLADTRVLHALLFGAAGLLPALYTVRDRESRAYARALLRAWRRLRPGLSRSPLREEDWKFSRLRPANFPTARLAVVCALLPSLFAGGAVERIVEAAARTEIAPRRRLRALRRLLGISPAGYWRRHLAFGEKGAGIALGRGRVHALIASAVVPLLLVLARRKRDRVLRARAIELLSVLPASGESALTREMRRRICRGGRAPRGALAEQGLIGLYRSWCARGRCRTCPAVAQKVMPTLSGT